MKIPLFSLLQNNMSELLTTLASIMGIWAFFQTLLYSLFPQELRYAFLKLFRRFFSFYCYYDIPQINGINTNELYDAVQLYLSSSALQTAGNRYSLTRDINSTVVTFGFSNNDGFIDNYKSVSVVWKHVITPLQSHTLLHVERRGFTLRVKKKDKWIIIGGSYLDYVIEKANEIRRENQDRLIYTNSSRGDSRSHLWESVPFKHPSTFTTLAMDPDKKSEIMSDLGDFANGELFYKKTGRAWKRGYLLYGPPGTGKSSMIAAIANYLKYDIYDLELTQVHSNSQLKKLLMKTSSKSVIVIEDIDCSINLSNRKNSTCGSFADYDVSLSPEIEDGSRNTVTLSGLLNFTDGLWSCCGSERIFVFTTNHIEKLDPALVRSGRMDIHVNMSFCTYFSVKILLKNYLGYEDGDLEEEVEDQLKEVVAKAEMTPADVSEILIKSRRDKVKAMKGLLETMKMKANEKSKGD